MRILALDLSLTATGVCDPDGHTGVWKPNLRGAERLRWFADTIADTIRAHTARLVVLEGYSYGSLAKREQMGELGGVARLVIYTERIPYAEIPPTCLKRYATGRGNATKDQVLIAGVKRSGIEFADNNACDAWWLWAMTHDHLGTPKVDVPATHREALRNITWPQELPDQPTTRRPT